MSTKSRSNTLRGFLERVLKDSFPDQVSLHKNTLTFRIEGRTLTFDNLLKLSEALKSKLINIGAEHSGPGCDTCGYGESTWVEVTVLSAKIPSHIKL